MKCKHCKAEFDCVGAKKLPVLIINSCLAIECPLCEYRQYIEIGEGGAVKIVEYK